MIKIRTRLVNKKKIEAMPLHNLRLYKISLHKSRNLLNDSLKKYCCDPVGLTCEVIESREATKEEAEMIKELDWRIGVANYEIDAKKIREK